MSTSTQTQQTELEERVHKTLHGVNNMIRGLKAITPLDTRVSNQLQYASQSIKRSKAKTASGYMNVLNKAMGSVMEVIVQAEYNDIEGTEKYFEKIAETATPDDVKKWSSNILLSFDLQSKKEA